MNALTLTLIKLAFLAVLWLFVIAAVGVVRTDLFGPSRRRRAARKARAPRAAAPPPAAAARAAAPGVSRSAPHQMVVTAGGLRGHDDRPR